MAPRSRVIPVTCRCGPPERFRGPALAVGIPEGARRLHGGLAALDERLGRAITRRLAPGDFGGRVGEATTLEGPREWGIDRLVLFGLGGRGDRTPDRIRQAGAAAAREAQRRRVGALAVHLPPGARPGPRQAASALAEGILLAAYRFDRYRTRGRGARGHLSRAVILVESGAAGLARFVRRGCTLASATCLARDLANTPSCDLSPARLAAAARRVARGREMRCRVLDLRGIRRAGMRALAAVGQASRNEPRFIQIETRPPSPAGTLVLVGKGITFDSGGISLKPSKNLWDMKFDKSGAAAVLGAIQACADLALPVRVIALVPAAENMPGGGAYRPGDVIRTLSGRTVEVRSTDAEGRLVLADALHHATRLRPDALVDVATLTGACAVALGEEAAGLFGTDEGLVGLLLRAGEETGERLWRLPLWQDYERRIRSEVADVKNTGGRLGGAITAAAFLRKFAGGVPWAHIDIAGPAHLASPRGYHPSGATGFGARLLVRFVEAWAERARGKRRRAGATP